MRNSAIDTIFKENRSLLKNFAGQFTNDPDEKEDLVQDTIMKSLSTIDRFINHPKLLSWLFIIMKNTYINYYRKKKRFDTFQGEMIAVNTESYVSVNKGENRFVNADIENALQKLPKSNYEVFAMFLEGYKYHEIAEHLNIPEGTVKTRIHVARKSLQKQLKTYQVSN